MYSTPTNKYKSRFILKNKHDHLKEQNSLSILLFCFYQVYLTS